MHDPLEYKDPERFCPERFIRNEKLDADVRDPYDFIFGFGRRYEPARLQQNLSYLNYFLAGSVQGGIMRRPRCS